MRNKFKRAVAFIASTAVMANSLIASMPLAAYEADAGGIVGDDTSVDIGNTSQGTDLVESVAINETNFLMRFSAPMWIRTLTRRMIICWMLRRSLW